MTVGLGPESHADLGVERLEQGHFSSAETILEELGEALELRIGRTGAAEPMRELDALRDLVDDGGPEHGRSSRLAELDVNP